MSKNTNISELINYLSYDGSGNIVFNTVSSATTNTDKFLVSDTGVLKFRTAAQLLSDIGAQASGSYQTALSGTGFVKISGSTISYDNSTYATETYVGTAISNLVASSPATLDTLNELALALGSDPNFATTVATSIGTKQAQLNGTGFVKITGTTISYDNSTYLTTGTASSTYLTTTTAGTTYVPYTGANADVVLGTNNLKSKNTFAEGDGLYNGGGLRIKQYAFQTDGIDGYNTISSQTSGFAFSSSRGSGVFNNFILDPTSLPNNTQRSYILPNANGTLALTSDLSTYLPLAGGTLTGALSGTSATFSSTLTANTGTGATFRAVFDSTNIVEIGNYSVASGYQGLNIIGSPIKFYTGTPGAGGATLALTIATNQLATFSNDILLSKSVDPKISSGTNIGLNIDGAALYLNRYSQSNIVMVSNGGQVGIGDVPSYTLHVKKNANQVAGFESPNANTWIDLVSTAGNWSLGSSSTDTSSFGVYQRVSGGSAVNKEYLNVNSLGNLGINLQGSNANFQITSPDYDGYEAVTMLGYAQPTIRYAGSNRFNITSTGFYCGLRTQSSRWRYMRIEADIKSSNADHFGFFWSSDKASTLGIGDGNVGYKWVFQPNSNSINIRDINTNGDLATSSTLPFDEKDGNWHHYVTELSHDGRVKIWVDGVLYHNRYGYNPGFGYCGISNYTGTLEVSNFTITSSETVVQDVAFFAYHNGSDVNYVPNDVLPYQNELYDYGGGYNTNGTYTAPVAGMYMFSATCNANTTSSGTYSTIVPRAYWQINSANIGNSIHFRGNDLAGAATSGLTQRSATVVLYLNYGDTVRIQVQQGQYDLFGANHFCGYLLK